MAEHTLTEADLAGFTGTARWYKHGIFPFTYTDGVRHVAEAGGAYWLIDAIFSHQVSGRVRREEFQLWTLKLDGKGGATLKMTDGNDNRAIARQVIEYTDFPLPEIRFYFENRVLCLPGER